MCVRVLKMCVSVCVHIYLEIYFSLALKRLNHCVDFSIEDLFLFIVTVPKILPYSSIRCREVLPIKAPETSMVCAEAFHV